MGMGMGIVDEQGGGSEATSKGAMVRAGSRGGGDLGGGMVTRARSQGGTTVRARDVGRDTVMRARAWAQRTTAPPRPKAAVAGMRVR